MGGPCDWRAATSRAARLGPGSSRPGPARPGECGRALAVLVPRQSRQSLKLLIAPADGLPPLPRMLNPPSLALPAAPAADLGELGARALGRTSGGAEHANHLLKPGASFPTCPTPHPPMTSVFAYGSLLFKPPPFDGLTSVPGYIKGHVRRFAQDSHDHRGTPERPGRGE